MTTGMSRSLLFWLAVMLIVMGGTGIWLGRKYSDNGFANSGSTGLEVDADYQRVPPDGDAPWLKEFTLVERSGKKVKSAELKNQVYITNFFYSTCPTTCRKQNEKLQEVELEYGKKGVKFLSISCDPETDSPSRLRDYANTFKADSNNWMFLTGDLTYIRRIAGEIYQTPLDRQTHTEHFYVTDKWGNPRGRYMWNKLGEVTELKILLNKLLAETEPPAKPAPEKKAEVAAEDTTEEMPAEESTTKETEEAVPASSAEEAAKPTDKEEPAVTEPVASEPGTAEPQAVEASEKKE